MVVYINKPITNNSCYIPITNISLLSYKKFRPHSKILNSIKGLNMGGLENHFRV